MMAATRMLRGAPSWHDAVNEIAEIRKYPRTPHLEVPDLTEAHQIELAVTEAASAGRGA
jgi:hypothetical protein